MKAIPLVKMNKKPKISVIMSVYNGKKYLDESIQSILNQTFTDFEFIIVNDASTDKSLEIIKKYQKEDKRILSINNEENIGLTKSLNKALKKAKGSYIARQDVDDASLPERLEKQYIFLEKNKDIFLCGANRIDIDEKGDVLRDKGTVIVGCEKIENVLKKKNCIVHSSIMFKNNGFLYRDKFRYSQDYDFYLNLLTKGLKLDNLEEKLLRYRNVSGSIGVSKKAKQDIFAEKAKEFYEQRIKTGEEEYDEFNPEEILKMRDKNTEKIFLKLKMELHLKNGDSNGAKKVLSEYKKLKGVSFMDTIPYSICTNFPFVYEFYRRVFYNDKIG